MSSAERQRALEHGRAPRIVDDTDGASRVRDGRQRLDIDDAKERIRRCLDPDEPRVVPDGVANGAEIGHVDRGQLQSPWPEHFTQQLDGAVERVIGGDDMCPRSDRLHQRHGGRGSGCEGAGRGAALERGQALLE